MSECTGYFGRFCNKSCPPGRFGHRCGGSCSPECTDEFCNPVSGCHLITKTTTQLTVSDSVYSTQTPGIIDRSVEGNSQSMETTITISLSSETNTKNHIFSKETTLQKSKINTNYLLAGSGALIFMLFVVIVIQSIRKSKSVKRNHETGDEPVRQPPNGHNKKYWNITSSKQSNHFYQHVDSVYQEIDESVELMPIPASTEKTNELGDHSLSKCINNSISNVTEHDDLNAQMPKESTCLNTDKADYLEPVFVRANVEIESKQKIHSYMTG